MSSTTLWSNVRTFWESSDFGFSGHLGWPLLALLLLALVISVSLALGKKS